MSRPVIACLDMEGVLVPEIWVNVAQKTGIRELSLTTREVPDYDLLMKRRLGILDRHRLRLPDLQAVIATMAPLEGAGEFLEWLRERCQVVILSDTYYEFAMPLMKQLAYPTLFCNRLEVDADGRIINYHLRLPDQKRQSVAALKRLRFMVVAAGDSYNDTSMLAEADAGILFRPPDTIIKEFPQFPVTRTFAELKEQFCKAGGLRD
ncbi:MAG: bifunctional phosphoserine phosphatase/homoserine phosphotransferase ThrH [Nitrospirae bacterium]|nr:MAG: bifunctional phosphoserine phosphatase/homoserine phosphotransferase ThrH [Nitrospirota bacterium]